MNKNFNSFREMMNTASSENGFRSFNAWAKSNITTPQNESQENTTSTPVSNYKESKEPEVEEIVENNKSTGDVVSILLEKLSDFDWEEITPKPNKIKEKKERVVEEKVTPERVVEEKIVEKEVFPKKEKIVEEPQYVQEQDDRYKIFKDRDENFECNLSVEGTTLADAKVRVVIESESWNFVFYGDVLGNGKCIVPLKRGIPLNEGAIGKIRLEVIAEDQLFVGWEDEFRIAASKKVKVEVKESKSVKVSFNNSLNRTH